MEGIYTLNRRLSNDKSSYELHTLKRGSVDFTIESFRNGVPYGLHIERGPDPLENIEFIWMKNEIIEVFYWDYTCGLESVRGLREFCSRWRIHFQEDLLPLRIMAEKAMNFIYHLWNRQEDMYKDLTLKRRFERDLFGHFYDEDLSLISKNKLVTFLVLEEGLGFLALDSLVYYLSLRMGLIEEFLIY